MHLDTTQTQTLTHNSRLFMAPRNMQSPHLALLAVLVLVVWFQPWLAAAQSKNGTAILTPEDVQLELYAFQNWTYSQMDLLYSNDTALRDMILSASADVSNLNSTVLVLQNTSLNHADLIASLQATDVTMLSELRSLNVSVNSLLALTSNMSAAFTQLQQLLANDAAFIAQISADNLLISQLNASLRWLDSNFQSWSTNFSSTLSSVSTSISSANSTVTTAYATFDSLSPILNNHTAEIAILKTREGSIGSTIADLAYNVSLLRNFTVNIWMNNNQTADFLGVLAEINRQQGVISGVQANASVVQQDLILESQTRLRDVQTVNDSFTALAKWIGKIQNNQSLIEATLDAVNLTRLNEFSLLNWTEVAGQHVHRTIYEYPVRTVYVPSDSLAVQNIRNGVTSIAQTIRASLSSGLCLVLVVLGYALREMALVRVGHAESVFARLLLQMAVVALAVCAVGYPFAMGTFTGMDLNSEYYYVAWFVVFVICLQGTFIATVSWAERTSIWVYGAASFVYSAGLCPLAIHFLWPYVGSRTSEAGTQLFGFTFTDYGGAAVLHLTASCLSLVGVLFIGPRQQARHAAGLLTASTAAPAASTALPPSYQQAASSLRGRCGMLLIAVAGTLLFLCFPTVHGIPFDARAPENCVVAMATAFLVSGADTECLVAAIVSISACAHMIQPPVAAAAAVVVTICHKISVRVMRKRFLIDDAGNIFSIHMIPACLSLLLVCAIRWRQSVGQLIVLSVVLAVAFVVSYLLFSVLRKVLPSLRLPIEIEEQGLDGITLRKVNFAEFAGNNNAPATPATPSTPGFDKPALFRMGTRSQLLPFKGSSAALTSGLQEEKYSRTGNDSSVINAVPSTPSTTAPAESGGQLTPPPLRPMTSFRKMHPLVRSGAVNADRSEHP